MRRQIKGQERSPSCTVLREKSKVTGEKREGGWDVWWGRGRLIQESKGCCSMWLNKRQKRCDTVRIWSAANELGVKTDSFAEETDLNITSRGFMTGVWKTDREKQKGSLSTSQFISHTVLKTYFPWREWRKSIDGVRNVPHFRDDRFLKPTTRSFTLSGDVWQRMRIFVRFHSCASYYISEVRLGIWQNVATLRMSLMGTCFVC